MEISQCRPRGEKRAGLTALFLMAVVAASLAVAPPGRGEEIPFDVANIFFELNDTDGDLGIHALIDGEPWRKLSIKDPNGRKLLSINVTGNLRQQGLTEIFYESAEPPFQSMDPDEETLSPEEFFDRFPEGEYRIEGKSLEKDKLKSTAMVTHVMPAPADTITVNGAPAAANCDVVPLPIVADPVTIQWNASDLSHPTIGVDPQVAVNIINQQVVVELADTTTRVFSVDLPPPGALPGMTSFEVPGDFTALGSSGDVFKFEILLREESGNQTAVESCYELS